MKKSDLRKIIKEELVTVLKEASNPLNTEILDAIDNMHALINKIKNSGVIPRGVSRRLYTEFQPLYQTLNRISDTIMKKEK